MKAFYITVLFLHLIPELLKFFLERGDLRCLQPQVFREFLDDLCGFVCFNFGYRARIFIFEDRKFTLSVRKLKVEDK